MLGEPSSLSSAAPPAGGARPFVPFSEDDLARAFSARTVRRARDLLLRGAARLEPAQRRIEATVFDEGHALRAWVSPVARGPRTIFDRRCACNRSECAHIVAAALLALESEPGWRRSPPIAAPAEVAGLNPYDAAPESEAADASGGRGLGHPWRQRRRRRGKSGRTVPQKAPSAPAKPQAAPERLVAVWRLEPGEPGLQGAAAYVSAALVPQRLAPHAKGKWEGIESETPATPKDVFARVARDVQGDRDRGVARILGTGGLVRTALLKDKPEIVDTAFRRLLATGRLLWRDGTRLVEGPKKTVFATLDPETRRVTPAGIAPGAFFIKGAVWWCVDPAAGRLHPADVKMLGAEAAAAAKARSDAPLGYAFRPRAAAPLPPPPVAESEPLRIVDRQPRVRVRVGHLALPDEGLSEVLKLSFDYGDAKDQAEIDGEDQRQFVKARDVEGPVFCRRVRAVEEAAQARLAGFGFLALRVGEPSQGAAIAEGRRGPRVFVTRGKDAAERWSSFREEGVKALVADGWIVELDADLGVTILTPEADPAVALTDAGEGWFDFDVGVVIDGERVPLLPVLQKIVDDGGMEAAKIIDGRVHAVLPDGRVLSLPEDRVRRLVSVFEAMTAGRRAPPGETLRVPLSEADALVDVDDLIARRVADATRIDAYLERFREAGEPQAVEPSKGFNGELRHYQKTGLGWLQGLRASACSGILADEMGLGKTPQTLAFIALERELRRLNAPCLLVVRASIIAQWVEEAARFTPGLKVVVMHGESRRLSREEIETAHLVVTTYAVAARDDGTLRAIHWGLVVLDEAQAIKNPESKTARALRALEADGRLCLTGTPVENNLMELWSLFAFLMPGLLGDRKEFTRRFRTPIEKRGDATRAALLHRRIRPFLLRRTIGEVARDLPPKTEVVERVDMNEAQRDLYEAIRVAALASAKDLKGGWRKNQISTLAALLKLRQACCDPRLLKLPSAHMRTAQLAAGNAKLERLMEMLGEMVPQGRRILVFSQFTEMLDLMKPRLDAAGVEWVELTGADSPAARDAAVKRFQSGEVPVFLISLKAGGVGLNLTAADTVIIYDPWWNPAVEAQAAGRAHRRGQTKPVFVYRLIAAGTVEDRIVELQKRKGNLAAAAIGGGALAKALSDADFDYLFRAMDEEEEELAAEAA